MHPDGLISAVRLRPVPIIRRESAVCAWKGEASDMRIKIKSKKNSKRFKQPHCWVAMGTLAAYAVNSPTYAQTQQPAPGVPGTEPSNRTLPVIKFNINAGLLDDVLRDFE